MDEKLKSFIPLLYCNFVSLLGPSSSSRSLSSGLLCPLPKSWWWSSNLPLFSGTIPHNLGVDRTRDTVVKLCVQLGQRISFINRCLHDVTNGSSFDNVSNDKLLDCLVLGDASSAVGTSDMFYMSPTMLSSSIVSSLGCLLRLFSLNDDPLSSNYVMDLPL